jgi:hypothetical protein
MLRRWRNDGPAQLRLLFLLGGAAVVFIVPVSAILTALALTSNADSADRLAAVGDVLVGATLLLGLAAALVTLFAFMTAVGLPKLRIQLACEFSKPNNPIFEADRLDNDAFRARQSKQLSGRIAIWNDGPYPAREPRIIVRLNSMAITAGSGSRFLNGWSTLDTVDTIGTTAIEWEGGLGYSIHPHSVRRLPGFYLNDLRWKEEWGEPGFTIEILLDNMRHVVYLPVGFEVDGELLAMKKADRGTTPPWRPPPPEKPRRETHGVEVYTQLPNHAQERQVPGEPVRNAPSGQRT